jgi:hypothetical protein
MSKTNRTTSGMCFVVASALLICLGAADLASAEQGWDNLERQFDELPMEAKRLTGPLFWLHGDENETKERLEMYVEKIAEGGNGCFVTESRPHSDWLGPKWYKDVEICIKAAERLNLKVWVFDERWWPSQTIAGDVPAEYRVKRLAAEAADAKGPMKFEAAGYEGDRFLAAIAGRKTSEGIDGDSLVDLKPFIKDGKLTWNAPEGDWQVMKFSWVMGPKNRQCGNYSVDPASRDCVDWFIQRVYQPHYDLFKEHHGNTVVGYFYDEPEVQGDWGTEMMPIFREKKLDWKKAYVAWKYELAGEQRKAARYAYIDTYFEAASRTMYGGMTNWCNERETASIGHFMDHDGLYLDHGLGPGNQMQMHKYSSMGGMDLVVRQLYPGERRSCYHLPKLTSSTSHAYNMKDHLAMCEIFGDYGQKLTYTQMKWLADQHQVDGVNFLITHSFNPKSPNDKDYPPYFYNSGHEPRWPLYRVWADYTNRLSLLLTGGRHVCPVALLFVGNSAHVGEHVSFESMSEVLQDALFDRDLLPYDAFLDDARIMGKEIHLHDERYKVLIVPPVEVIPFGTLEKVEDFFDAGGIVVGYDRLPIESATIGRNSDDITKLRKSIWGDAKRGLDVCKKSAFGGRSYFLPAKPTPEQIQQVLTGDAGIHPTLEVLEGDTNHWLHVLHRVKEDRDVFLICNQNHEGPARTFKFRVRAAGIPECWDAMHNEITSVDFTQVNAETVDVELTFEPSESVLLVFQKNKTADRPARITKATKPIGEAIPITGVKLSAEELAKLNPEFKGNAAARSIIKANPFVGHCVVPPGVDLSQSQVYLEIDAPNPTASASVKINGKYAGGMIGGPYRLNVTKHLKQGKNAFRIEPVAPKSARLVVY